MIQSKTMLIGLTGGIASGKSTVSSYIEEKGYSLIDADKIAREVVEIGEPAYNEIVEEFGSNILQEDKNINRKVLGNIIFNDEKSRQRLNSIIHPYIFKTIKLKVDELSDENKIVFLDIPLLFEQYDLWEEYNIRFDEIWLVYLNKKLQIERLIKRDKISKTEALRKIESQMPIDTKKTRSSKTIDNSGDVEYLKEQINKMLSELI